MAHEPLFFLHFPRTAGTTVDDIFFANFPADKIIKVYSEDEFAKYRCIDEGMFANIGYITGHLLLESVNPPRFYGKRVRAFTFLREPVKRLYSEYIFLKTWKSQHLYEYLNSNDISFSQYITSSEKLLRYRGKNFMTRCLSGEALEKCELAEALEKAKYNLKNNLICFGLQERFMESLLLLAREANLQNILHQRRNSLNYGAMEAKISEEEKATAIEYNSADIELYDFAVELFDERVREKGAEFQTSLNNFKFLNSKYQNIANLLYSNANKESDKNINLSKDVKW